MHSKLIVIMIDGVSSDYFIDFPQYMPYSHALAKDNTVVTNLAPEQCGSSLPGRTSMLTGQISRNHGIYGNNIWDPHTRTFRYASPYDVRSPSLFSHAKNAGLDTANIGFGMTRPEDCNLYVPPYWVNDFVSRSRDDQPVPVSADWRKALTLVDDGRIEREQRKPGNSDVTLTDSSALNEVILDQHMIQLVCELVGSANPPDLIFTEINVTDSMQHRYGYASANSNFSIAYADMLVGQVAHALKQADLDSQYTLIVTSDHGHGDTQRALYVNNIIADPNWSSECAVMFLEQNSQLNDSIDALQTHGAQVLNQAFLPVDVQGQIMALGMKENISLELSPHASKLTSGPSKYKSSHSYYPGTVSDKRFAVISGPAAQNQHIEQATAEQLFVIMCNILGLTL